MSLPVSFDDITTGDGAIILSQEPFITAPEAIVEAQINAPTTPQWEIYVAQWQQEGRI